MAINISMCLISPKASSSSMLRFQAPIHTFSPLHALVGSYLPSLRSKSPRSLTLSHSSPSAGSVVVDAHAAEQRTEMDAIKEFSEIVPDTVIFDDFERFPPTAATASSSLLLGVASLPETRFGNVIEAALADRECMAKEAGRQRLSCFFDKALVKVGAELTKIVPGRVSTEVDARLAYDTQGTVRKVHELLRLYEEAEVSSERLLFKIPATWQGIQASRLLESEGIQTHVTFVYSFPQAAAAAQAGSSVVQIFVGRIRDWARNHSGDKEIERALARGEDPGIALVTKAFNFIKKYDHNTKLMAAAIRNKQDVFSLLGVDYVVVPLKILESLNITNVLPDEKYSFVKRLVPEAAKAYSFTDEELLMWDQASFSSALGPAAEELLRSGVEGYMNQTKRVEAHFEKIWPPPNV